MASDTLVLLSHLHQSTKWWSIYLAQHIFSFQQLAPPGSCYRDAIVCRSDSGRCRLTKGSEAPSSLSHTEPAVVADRNSGLAAAAWWIAPRCRRLGTEPALRSVLAAASPATSGIVQMVPSLGHTVAAMHYMCSSIAATVIAAAGIACSPSYS